MKKVLTILVVLTVIAGFAFADAQAPSIVQPKVTLTTTVKDIAPVFGIHHSDTDETDKGVDSIAEGNIVADFVISQDNPIDLDPDTGYSNYGISAGTAVSLTVTCSPFKNNDATSTSVAVISLAANGEIVDDKLTYGDAPENGSNVAVFVPTYHGKRVDNQTVGTFRATWAQDTDLPFGTYTADITLAFTSI